MLEASCPECSDILEFEEAPTVGDEVICDSCGTTCQITTVSPLTIEAIDYEEDPDDDDEDDDDDDLDDDEEDDDYPEEEEE